MGVNLPDAELRVLLAVLATRMMLQEGLSADEVRRELDLKTLRFAMSARFVIVDDEEADEHLLLAERSMLRELVAVNN